MKRIYNFKFQNSKFSIIKNILKQFFIILCFLIFIKSSIAQLQFFDSVKTVVSSSIYDYKNPVFNGESTNSNFSWLAYERHNGNSSDIVVRKAGYTDYDSEIVITNTVNALNINPTIYKGMIVWQSNVRGNWDLYYSKLISGVSWSAPVLVDSSSFDETNPYVVNNNLEPEQYNYTFLVYKRNNSIRFKKYKTTSGIWSNDTLVTDGTYEDATPMICKGSSGAQFGVVFLRKYSANVSRLNQRLFYENYNNSPIVWDNVYEIFQPNPQNNLSLSYTGLEFLSYSYDTLNSTHILGFNLNGQNFKEVITKNVPGKHLSGKGSLMGIVLDNMYYFFSVFSTITRFSDSLYLTFINHPGSFNKNPLYKKIYLSDTNTTTKFDVSQPIFSQNLYRIKTIWEKKSGNRTILVESFMTDILNDIFQNSINVMEFSLSQNYPNPFNPSTIINYQLAIKNDVSLKIYNALGKEVATLVNEKQNAGSYEVEFNGEGLPSGVYFYKLVVSSPNQIEAGNFTETKRMLLIK